MGSGYYQRRMDWRFSISNQGWHVFGTRSRSDQRCIGMDLKGVYMETIRKIGFIGEQDLTSIILKMKSNVFKGKVADDHKWVKTAERGYKGTSSYHGNSRGDAGGSHKRSLRREEMAVVPQEVHRRASPRHVEEQNGREVVLEGTREGGEIKSTEEETLASASKEFQVALAETQANGLEMISDPVDREEGLLQIQSLVVKDRTSDRVSEGDEEDVMEMDEFQAALLEHGLDEQTIDALPAVSEEELKEMMAGYEEDDQLQEAGEQTNGAEEKNKDTMEQAQKQGTRKRLFKSSVIVAGSTKMRNAVALVSPRKRAAARMGTRKGDTNKQLESKGSSNLNSGNLKFNLWIKSYKFLPSRNLEGYIKKLDDATKDYSALKLTSETREAADADIIRSKEEEIQKINEKMDHAVKDVNESKDKVADLTEKYEDAKRMLEIELASVHNLRHELEGTKRTLQASRERVSDLEKMLDESRALCSKFESEVSKVHEEFDKAKKRYEENLADERRNGEVLASELAVEKDHVKKARDEIEELRREVEEASAKNQSLQKELVEVYKRGEATNKELKEEKETVSALEKEVKAMEKQMLMDREAMKALETDLEEAVKSLDEMNKNTATLSRELEKVNTHASSLEDEREVLQGSLEEARNASKEAKENVEDAHIVVMSLGKEREVLEKKVKKLEEELGSAKGEIVRMRSQQQDSIKAVNSSDER
ncbi:hypothetical protein IGI04_013086 [Brassica rapa subsp. trilocularis]|uniref:Uncharacterized protein n=1 Tax=Brassica rapa subsp. trilocularis TaxID=1813537 RepID=A0ABQ7N7T2_BRACM|nr:hypothetical protein IGI04_013086 [Brassica rapa subsp. trilocularis]